MKFKRVRILKQITNDRPDSETFYLSVHFYANGARSDFQVHRLVATAFIPNPENKPEVNHKNGKKNQNDVVNLEWVTTLENMQHAHSMGFIPRQIGRPGESNPMHKLTFDQVFAIKDSKLTQKVLAKMYSVSQTTVSFIKNQKTWRAQLGE